jgi:hypothetical protein
MYHPPLRSQETKNRLAASRTRIPSTPPRPNGSRYRAPQIPWSHQSGIKRALAYDRDSLLDQRFGLYKPIREPTCGLEPLTLSHYECAVTYAAVCRSVRKRCINKPNPRFRNDHVFAVYRRIPPTLSSKLSST